MKTATQPPEPRRQFRGDGDVLAPCHNGGLRSRTTAGASQGNEGRGAGRDGASPMSATTRRTETGANWMKTTVIWLGGHMYLGESPGRRVALSSGSDCDAVWPCPRHIKTPVMVELV